MGAASDVTIPLPYAIIERERVVGGQRLRERGVELRFHPGQQAAYDSLARIIAMIAGTQGGKTSFGPWWLYREITLEGPGDYLAVTGTYDLFKLKMLPAIREVMEHVLGIARYWAGDQVLEICEHEWDEALGVWVPQPGRFRARQSTDPMWARVILRSASSEGGLESATAKGAWLDEAGLDDFGLGAWEAILRRLALYRGRILITTTPYNNTGWLKTEVWDRWNDGDEQVEVIQFASIMNPAFPEDEYKERQRHMIHWKFTMFYKGEFERPAGLVYPDWSDSHPDQGGQVITAHAIPPDWGRLLGVDPGPVYYTLLHAAVEPGTDTLIITREEQFSYQSTEEIVADLFSRQRGLGLPPFLAYYVGGKPDVQARLDWINAGAIPVYDPPFSAVEDGIDRVTHLLRSDRLRVFATCSGLRADFNTYRRKLDSAGRPLEAIENANAYHYLDALRYIAAGFTVVRDVIVDDAPPALQTYRGDGVLA